MSVRRQLHCRFGLLTMMKQLSRLIPLVRPKLPRLPSRHDTNYPIPRIRSKFSQSFNGVDDEVPSLRLGFSA